MIQFLNTYSDILSQFYLISSLLPGTSVYPYSPEMVSWVSQEEPDIDSSNEEDDTKMTPEGLAEGDPASSLEQSTQ